MKSTLIILSLLGLFFSFSVNAQEQFTVQIEPLTIAEAPNIHSYSWGKTSDGKWLIVGGRIDGLHRRQPWAAFLASDNNTDIILIDPITDEVWSTSLSVLPLPLFEQLQSTNQEFIQRDNSLYVIGGYGYSATAVDHITFSNLTAINIDGVANAILNGTSINSYFRQTTDSNLAVTGGQLGLIDEIFYLSGGQYFEGRYNPIGPGQGSGFIQEYTDEIRKFEIVDDGTNLSISNFTMIHDTDNLHRRDYNMVPQIFPNGELGLTMFSGVFHPVSDLPWLNSVDITPSGYQVNNSFSQLLNQYHSAKLPIHDQAANNMHTIIFGGLSQYYFDANDNLIQDDEVPFVKTISKVTRASDGSMLESKLDIEMPAFLGSGAEFIPISDTQIFSESGILNLNNLADGSTHVGYIYGGIESSQENIFFINDGTQSEASNLIFKVFINKGLLGTNEIAVNGDSFFNMIAYPNPSSGIFSIEFSVPNDDPLTISIIDLKGSLVQQEKIDAPEGRFTYLLDLANNASGEYIVIIKGSNLQTQTTLIKR